jgi:hypothetical protein
MVSTDLRKVSYTTTSNQTAFPFQTGGVKIPLTQAADLFIKVSTDAEPLDPALYTVTGNNTSGWTLTLLSALPAGTKVTLYRQTSMLRNNDFQENARLFPDTLDSDADRLTMRDIEQQEELNRANKGSIDSDDDEGYTFPSRDSAKGKVLCFDPTTGDMTPTGKIEEVSGLSELYKSNEWDNTETYAAGTHTYYQGEPYKPNVANLPAVGESPATNPEKWIKTGGGGTGIGNIAPDPTGSKGTSDWTTSSVTVTSESTTLTGFATELKLLAAGAGNAYQSVALPTQLRGEEIEIRFEGYLNSGTPTFSVENQSGTVIPSAGALPTASGKFVFVGRFYTATDTTGLRIKFTGSGAFDLRLTNIYIGRPQTTYGAAISGDYSYNPWDVDHVANSAGFGTPTSVDFKWSREVGYVIIQGKFTAGTTTATEGRIALPKGLTSLSTIPTIQSAQGFLLMSSTGFMQNCLVEPNKGYITFGTSDSGNAGLTKRNASSLIGTGVVCSLFVRVPINEFVGGAIELASMAGPLYLSNTESVANTNGVVAKTAYGIGGSPILANTAATYYDMTLPRDLLPDEVPHIEVLSKVDGNWVPVEYAYVPSLNARLGGQVLTQVGTGTGSYASNAMVGFHVAKTTSGVLRVFMGYGLAGDKTNGANTIADTWADMLAAADGYTRWRVRIEKAGSAREQTPKVYAEMTGGSGISPCIFSTIVEDTHNCLTIATGRFICKVPGLYSFSAKITTGNVGSAWLRKNGVNAQELCNATATFGAAITFRSEVKIRLSVGDYLDTTNTTSGWINGVQITGPF